MALQDLFYTFRNFLLWNEFIWSSIKLFQMCIALHFLHKDFHNHPLFLILILFNAMQYFSLFNRNVKRWDVVDLA